MRFQFKIIGYYLLDIASGNYLQLTLSVDSKKRKKGKCELVSYFTIIVVVTGGDNAVGLSTDSQTNAVAV